MLPKFKRLNLKKDFDWVKSQSKVLDSRFLKLLVREGENTIPKIGVAVSSKVFKKAHDRNFVKRRTFATFGNLYSLLPSNINIIALPKRIAFGVKSFELDEDVMSVLKKVKILK